MRYYFGVIGEKGVRRTPSIREKKMSEITQLTGTGIGALAVLLFYKLAASHIKNNTIAIRELSQLIRELKPFLINSK